MLPVSFTPVSDLHGVDQYNRIGYGEDDAEDPDPEAVGRQKSRPSSFSSFRNDSNDTVGSSHRDSIAERSSESSARRTRTASSTTSETDR